MKKLKAFPINMQGFNVLQALPHPELEKISPFILLHHASQQLQPGGDFKELGVGPHPHRGFSPVSIIFEGSVHHRDSLGNSSIITKGGIQWINSGNGIIHSERPPKEVAENGGNQELIQLWINTPAKHKMDDAEYFAFEEDALPKIVGDFGYLSLIAGEYQGKKSPVKTFSEVVILRADLKENQNIELNFKENFNTSIYLLDGDIEIDGQVFGDKDLVVDIQNNTNVSIRYNTRALIMTGLPINEPMASYGPFVMNYEGEIKQAMLDYQSGKFGKLEEKFD